ncbi:MAG: nucleotidyltransferase family protein [Candidatus Liptonbacteria bacterium]|nr:nucleotidyltransferase family protein [Candidatus Liptonbacteria bacterium]
MSHKSSAISQAVILSAGLGTRLKEITGDAIPKVMVPLLGKPILEWQIERLKAHGVKEFFINLFYLPEKIRGYFGNGSKWDVKITYVLEEPEIRGTAGGMKNFSAEGGSASGGAGYLKDNFFVIYGDVYNEIDYVKMEAAFSKHARHFNISRPYDIKVDGGGASGAVAMTTIGENDHPWDSDLVEIADDGKFIKIHPKPHKELPKKYKAMRAAVFIFNERILTYIPAKKYYEIDHHLLPDVMEKGETVYGYEPSKEEFIKDIGTPERYRAVEEYLKTKKKTGA